MGRVIAVAIFGHRHADTIDHRGQIPLGIVVVADLVATRIDDRTDPVAIGRVGLKADATARRGEVLLVVAEAMNDAGGPTVVVALEGEFVAVAIGDGDGLVAACRDRCFKATEIVGDDV